ncbi:MAG: gamma-glutamylcyclotransferase family protein [Bosea sp. (in: a-proteobacteria)]
MPLYFAYGANMDREGMALRCPGAVALGVASLKRHRFFIMREGYASVRRDPRGQVFGVLWELTLAHIRALDKFEELDRGLYVKLVQPVVLEKLSKKALIYVAVSSEPGRPRPGYLEDVIAAATSWELPAPYLAGMRAMLDPRGAPPKPAVPGKAASRASQSWQWGEE